MRSTTHWAAALLVFGLAITGFAEDAELSDLCAVASVEGSQAGESGTSAALVVACAANQPSMSSTVGIGNQSHTVGDVGGESISAATTQIGNTSVTTGVVDGQPVSVTTIEIGNVTYATGQVGGESFSSSTIQIGDITYTTGQSDQ